MTILDEKSRASRRHVCAAPPLKVLMFPIWHSESFYLGHGSEEHRPAMKVLGCAPL